MVPWSHLRQPSLGWVMTVLTTELTHFNLVIHLSKSQQLAFPFCTFLWSPAFPAVLYEPSGMHLYWVKPLRTTINLIFTTTARALKFNMTCETTGNRHVLFLQVWSFWFLVRWNMLCIQFDWTWKPFYANWGKTWPRTWSGLTHDF